MSGSRGRSDQENSACIQGPASRNPVAGDRGNADKLIHEYFGVDLDIVWETTKEDLVPFETAVLSLLATLGESS